MLKTNALALVFWLGSAFATLKPAPRPDRTQLKANQKLVTGKLIAYE